MARQFGDQTNGTVYLPDGMLLKAYKLSHRNEILQLLKNRQIDLHIVKVALESSKGFQCL
jgi:hypothetical protein